MFHLWVLLFSLTLGRVKTSNKLKINLIRHFHWGSGKSHRRSAALDAEKMIVNGESHWGKQMKM